MAIAKSSKKKGKKRKEKKRVPQARVYIQSTYNNTLLTFTDPHGNVLAWSSAGRVGFSGAKKSTPFAAQRVVADAVERAAPFGVKEVTVFVKGIGSARESAVRALGVQGMTITSIHDVTPIPHNGCRRPKPRRV